MAIAQVQNSASASGAGTPTVASISLSPTAGNTVVVYVTQIVSNTRTYTVSDNIDGTTGWTQAVYLNPTGAAGIWYKQNVPSGITTITVTANTSTTTMSAAATEFSGMGTVTTRDAFDSLNETPTTSNTHTCSASGVTSANPVIAVCAGIFTASGGEINPGTGYNEVPTGFTSGSSLKQYQIFPSGCTSEVGTYTNTTTARSGIGAIALLSGNAAAAGGKPTHYYQQMSQ